MSHSSQSEEHNTFPRNSKSISFREYLSSTALKDSYLKLKQLGLNDISIFYHINERELDNICDQIFQERELSDFVKKIKFKASIRKLKILW
eukprot:299294_1